MNKKIHFTSIFSQILKGIGQIMLQENSWTGLLFLFGLFLGSWQAGIAVLTATLIGTITAHLLKYNPSEINSGLYGFSPALVGMVLAFFFQFSFLIWVFIVFGSIIAAILQHLFIQRNIPGYTFPFILVSWICIYFLQNFTDTLPSKLLTAEVFTTDYDTVLVGFRGFGQVIFQAGIFSGILFFIGVLISNYRAAIYAIIAGMIVAYFSYLWGQNIESIKMGLFSFNVVLTTIALFTNKLKDLLWLIIGVLLTIIIDLFLVETNVLHIVGGKLTFPFVLGTWITLLIKHFSQIKTNKT